MNIQFKRLNENALMPIYGSNHAAGMDLFSSNNEPITIEPNTRKLIPTGLAISYDDPTYYMRIAPRSGLSVKNNIDIGAGVIDYDYRGEIKIVVINNDKNSFVVKKNMKIAQMIPTKTLAMSTVIFVEVNEFEELHENNRGNNGFGSTGI